jgi:hypothetical protein
MYSFGRSFGTSYWIVGSALSEQFLVACLFLPLESVKEQLYGKLPLASPSLEL